MTRHIHRSTVGMAWRILVMCLFFWDTIAAAGSWSSDQFSFAAHDFIDIATGNGSFVAVAEEVVASGAIGAAPLICKLPLPITPSAVGRNAWHFLVVGTLIDSSGTGVILASPNGRAWREVFRCQGALRGIAWGNEQWLAVGDEGLVVASAELRDWQLIDPREQAYDSLYDAVWATDQWIAVGVGGIGSANPGGWVVTSPDGYSWATTARLPGKAIERVAWSGELAVTAPYGSYSSNGLDWSEVRDWHADDVLWDGTRFVAVDEWVFHYPLGTVMTSEDGINWEIVDDWGLPKRSISWDGTSYLCAGTGTIAESSNLVDWHALPQTLPPEWIADIAPTGCGINAIGNSNIPQGNGMSYPEPFLGSLTDDGGWMWTSFAGAGDCTVRHMASTGTRRVISCVDADFAIVSDDCATWKEVPFRCGGDYCAARGLIGSDVGFVLIADDGWILHSLDGFEWSSTTIEEIHRPDALAWTGERLVVAGDTGIATSFDGLSWEFHQVAGLSDTRAMASDGHRIVRVASDGISTALDYIHWVPVARELDNDFYDVFWTGDRFVAVGEHGRIATSENGVLWTAESSGFPPTLLAAHEVGDRLFVGGRSLMAHRDLISMEKGRTESPR